MNSRWWLLFALTACVDPDTGKDRDGDGYDAFQVGGDDCNDADPSVNPGATEICGDNIDNDCDSLVDDRGTGEQPFYADVDRDNYGAMTPVQACTAPANHLTTSGDCDDSRADVNPGATEVWYDGLDQDCDEADDDDQDGDGHASAAESDTGDDCDDTRASVAPSQPEVCGNHLDDDCDQTDNDCLWPLGVTQVHADIAYGGSEIPNVSVGDTDGDGADELLLWVEGTNTLAVFSVAPNDDLNALDAEVTITLPALTGDAYAVTLVPDVSGDGAADLLVGEWYQGYDGRVDVYRDLDDLLTITSADKWRNVLGHDVQPVNSGAGFGSNLTVVTPLPNAASVTWGTQDDRLSIPTCYLFNDFPTSALANLVVAKELHYCSELLPGALYNNGTPSALVRFVDKYHMVDLTKPGPIDVRDEPVYDDADGPEQILAFPVDAVKPEAPDVLVLRFNPSTSIDELAWVFDDDAGIYDGLSFVVSTVPSRPMVGGAVGDFNGDGHPDLVAGTQQNSGIGDTGLFLGPLADADVSMSTGTDAVPSTPPGRDMKTGDLNNDGYDDLVIPSAGSVYVLFGAGR